jgi:hypothetical protein
MIFMRQSSSIKRLAIAITFAREGSRSNFNFNIDVERALEAFKVLGVRALVHVPPIPIFSEEIRSFHVVAYALELG